MRRRNYNFKRLIKWLAMFLALLVIFFGSLYLVLRDTRSSKTAVEEVSGRLALIIMEQVKNNSHDYRNAVLEALKQTEFEPNKEKFDKPEEVRLFKNDTEVGRVVFGSWHFEHSSRTLARDRCYEDGKAHTSKNFRPCFMKVDVSKGSLNAAKVEIRHLGHTYTSVAAFSPKRILVMLDLGPGIVSDHYSYDRPDYVVELKDKVRCSSKVLTSIDKITENQQYKFTQQIASLSDYECHDLGYRSPSWGIPLKKSFLIRKSGIPQPLGDILSAIHDFMGRFSGLGISGDRFGLLAFDNENLPLRSTGGKSKFGFVEADLDDAEYFEFYEASGAFKSQPTSRGYEKYTSRMLFPRVTSDVFQRNKLGRLVQVVAATDIAGAVERASQMFSEDRKARSFDDSIVLITSGRSTCIRRGDCKNTMRYLRSSTEIAKKQLYSFARANGVTVDVVLSDLHSYPHNRLLSRGAKSCSGLNDCCLTALDYVAHAESLPDTVVNRSFLADDYQVPSWLSFPNVWAFVATNSQGIWSPIKPACSEFAQSNYSPEQITEMFAEMCRSGNKFGEVMVPAINKDQLWSYFGTKMYSVLGENGEFYCDPQGLSVAEQIKSSLGSRLASSRRVMLVDNYAQ